MEPDWEDLRFFLALARTGTLTAAAKSLAVERTTVSRRIAGLEATLGTRLFHRTARACLLTAEGERLRAAAGPMEKAAAGLREATLPRGPEASVTVRISTNESFATHWLAPRLPALRRAVPNVRVEILSRHGYDDLSRGETDIAVRPGRPRQRELAAVRIGQAASGLYASREMASAVDPSGKGITSAARGLPLLVYTEDLSFIQEARWFRPVLEHGDVRLRATSPEVIARAALAGHGVGVLPRVVARSIGPLLVPVAARDLSRIEVWILAHPEVRKSREVSAVQRFLKQIAGELR